MIFLRSVFILGLICFAQILVAQTQGLGEDKETKNSPKPTDVKRQSIIDSIVLVLEQKNTPHERFMSLIKIHRKRGISPNDRYVLILEENIAYAREHQILSDALPIINSLANYYIFTALEHEKAARLLEEYSPYISPNMDVNELRKFYVLLTEAAIYKNSHGQALGFIKEGLRLGDAIADSLNSDVAYLHLKAGESYLALGDAKEGVKYFNTAIRLFSLQNDTTFLLWSRNGLASLYTFVGLNQKAEEERAYIYEVNSPDKYHQVLAIARVSSSINARETENYEEEMKHLRHAIRHAEANTKIKEIIKIITYCFMTSAFARKNEVDSSGYYLAILDKQMEGNESNSFLNVYYQFARTYHALAKGELDVAEQISLKNMKEIGQLTNPRKHMESEHLLHHIYLQKKQFKHSLTHFQNYANLRDSVQRSENMRRFMFIQNEFETEKKDIQIAQQKSDIANIKSKHRNRILQGVLLLIALVSIFTGIYLYRSRKFTKKSMEMQADFTHNLINAQEDERRRLSRELHDGVAQELIYIKNKVSQTQDNETEQLVGTALQELRTISQALHPFVLEKFGLSQAVQHWIDIIDQRSDIFIDADVDEINGVFSKEQELHLYRIIQEAVNNVLKHANSPTLKLELKQYSSKVVVLIQDFGKGMDLTKDSEAKNSLGMKTIAERSQMIPAKLDINSTPNKGTAIQLTYEA